MRKKARVIFVLFALVTALAAALVAPLAAQSSLTPKPSPKPRINGASVFGVRPGSPFQYKIPATGERPIEYSASGLPAGLALGPKTGLITGVLKDRGEHLVTLKAKNALGAAEKKFKIVCGDTIALTPPMGWSTWYMAFTNISDEMVRANSPSSARRKLSF